MILFILFVIWILFSYLEGKRDASFFHANVSSPNPVAENLHWLFTFTRTIVLGLITWIIFSKYSISVTIIYAFSLSMIFSWIHNGVYYHIRHKLDSNSYPKGFYDTSTTSTSIIELDYSIRTLLALIGVMGIILTLFM